MSVPPAHVSCVRSRDGSLPRMSLQVPRRTRRQRELGLLHGRSALERRLEEPDARRGIARASGWSSGRRDALVFLDTTARDTGGARARPSRQWPPSNATTLPNAPLSHPLSSPRRTPRRPIGPHYIEGETPGGRRRGPPGRLWRRVPVRTEKSDARRLRRAGDLRNVSPAIHWTSSTRAILKRQEAKKTAKKT